MAFSIKGNISLDGQSADDELTQARFEEWRALIEGLSHRQLGLVAAILGADDEHGDCLRRLYAMLPALASPGRSLARAMAAKPLREWVEYAYQVAAIQLLLQGQVEAPTTFEGFAREVVSAARLEETLDAQAAGVVKERN